MVGGDKSHQYRPQESQKKKKKYLIETLTLNAINLWYGLGAHA